jgi:hypothetical protein
LSNAKTGVSGAHSEMPEAPNLTLLDLAYSGYPYIFYFQQ